MLYGISSLHRNTNIALSLIIIGVIIGFHGTTQPFNVKHKNYQELLLFLNLQALFVISLYDESDTSNTIVNALIMVGAFHFSFIIINHMITYMCGGVIVQKIRAGITTITEWITRLHNRSQSQQFQLQDYIRDNIPDVTYEYSKLCEPLIGQDS